MFAQRGLHRGATRLSIVSSVASAHSSHFAVATVQKVKQFAVILNPSSQYYNQLCIIVATKKKVIQAIFRTVFFFFTLLYLQNPNLTTISPVIPLSLSVGIYTRGNPASCLFLV